MLCWLSPGEGSDAVTLLRYTVGINCKKEQVSSIWTKVCMFDDYVRVCVIRLDMF